MTITHPAFTVGDAVVEIDARIARATTAKADYSRQPGIEPAIRARCEQAVIDDLQELRAALTDEPKCHDCGARSHHSSRCIYA